MPLCQFGFKFIAPFCVVAVPQWIPVWWVYGEAIWFSLWLISKLQRRGESGLMSVLWIKEHLWGPLVKASLPNWKFLAQQLPVKFLSASCPVWHLNKFLKDIRSSVYVRVLWDDRKSPSYLCFPWAVLLGQHSLSCTSWEHSHSGCLTSLFSTGES